MFLKNIIKDKNDTVEVGVTLQEAVDIMSELNLHYIIIIKDKKPLGIITQNDIVRLLNTNIDFERDAAEFATKNLLILHATRLTEHALNMMIDNNVKKIVVVNSSNEYQGCIEQEDLVYSFEERFSSSKKEIETLVRSNNIATVLSGDTDLKEALQVMVKQKLTSILVSLDAKPVGIISESDIVRLAKEHISLDRKIKEFMHSPLIMINSTASVSEMITLMKEKQIRRVVTYNKSSKKFHILNSKDVINDIKGSYTTFLESKLYDIRETFNTLCEYIIELVDLGDEQVIYWTNTITKENFDINIDDNITKVIPTEIWENIFSRLKEQKQFFDTMQINDSYFQIRAHYGSIMNDNVIKVFLNDITEAITVNKQLKHQNKQQEQMLYSQTKMAQLGEMIANIAHQWRQTLNVISTAASGLQLKKEFGALDDDFLDMTLSEIESSAQYLSTTIDTFRNFIKEKKVFKEVVLQDRIDKALDITKASLKGNYIKLINEIDYTQPLNIKLVMGEFVQVLINIINNAKDVLVEKNIPNPYVKIRLENLKEKVIITIEDNGGGIPDEVLPKVFDPYFTTKGDSNGTGLGLYMSQKIIVESLKGKLYVENTQAGAKFFIELPLQS
jgi:signal transduction histidine kinase/CBS domain-containing protein